MRGFPMAEVQAAEARLAHVRRTTHGESPERIRRAEDKLRKVEQQLKDSGYGK